MTTKWGGNLTIVSAKPKAIPAEDALVVVRMVDVTVTDGDEDSSSDTSKWT